MWGESRSGSWSSEPSLGYIYKEEGLGDERQREEQETEMSGVGES